MQSWVNFDIVTVGRCILWNASAIQSIFFCYDGHVFTVAIIVIDYLATYIQEIC
jgi:hypothetical protein